MCIKKNTFIEIHDKHWNITGFMESSKCWGWKESWSGRKEINFLRTYFPISKWSSSPLCPTAARAAGHFTWRLSLDVLIVFRKINIDSEHCIISVTIWRFTWARWGGGRRFVLPPLFLLVIFPLLFLVLFSFLLQAFHLLFLSPLAFVRWRAGPAALFLLLLCGLLLTWRWSRSGA